MPWSHSQIRTLLSPSGGSCCCLDSSTNLDRSPNFDHLYSLSGSPSLMVPEKPDEITVGAWVSDRPMRKQSSDSRYRNDLKMPRRRSVPPVTRPKGAFAALSV